MEVFPVEVEHLEQPVEVDPGGESIVVGEFELFPFVRECKALYEAGFAIDTGETAAAVFQSSVDDFE